MIQLRIPLLIDNHHMRNQLIKIQWKNIKSNREHLACNLSLKENEIVFRINYIFIIFIDSHIFKLNIRFEESIFFQYFLYEFYNQESSHHKS